jgi:hypothetical protein
MGSSVLFALQFIATWKRLQALPLSVTFSDALDPLHPLSLWVPALLLALIGAAAIYFARLTHR